MQFNEPSEVEQLKHEIDTLKRQMVYLENQLLWSKNREISKGDSAHLYYKEVVALNNSINKKIYSIKFYKAYVERLEQSIEGLEPSNEYNVWFKSVRREISDKLSEERA